MGDGWQQQSFEKGAIYTKNEFPASQASIQGEIWEKWQTMGAQNSALGYPISSEITVPKGKGKYNVFEGGVLYSHPEHGTHAVIGTILEDWTKNGFENGKLGSPIQDATITEEGLYTNKNLRMKQQQATPRSFKISSTKHQEQTAIYQHNKYGKMEKNSPNKKTYR